MNATIKQLRSELNDKLSNIELMDKGLERLNLFLKAIDFATNEINKVVSASAFEDQEAEITFFKFQKPELLARRIEEVTRYNLVVNAPIATSEVCIKYYEDELKASRSFFRMNNYHYQYYRNGLSDLDQLYFLRASKPLTVPVAEFSEIDNEFSTPMSYLFAKFMAYENMQYFILEQIAQIKHPENTRLKASGPASELKWTGDSVNIVELAYGIWLTGQLNNGNASLNQIVRWLETTLQISIGIIQRRFNEIERRKRLSPTKFIDQMKQVIQQKIDKGNK